MNKNILVTGALLASMFAVAQEKKVITNFSQLSVNNASNVYLQKSDTPYVIADFSIVSINSSDDALQVKLVKNADKDHSDKIIVGYTQINSIQIDGASSVKNSDTLVVNGDKLMLSTSSASTCKLIVKCNSIQSITNGASVTSLSGVVTTMDATLSGASVLKAQNLLTDEVNITASGASSAKIVATKKIVGNASGASDIKYSGNPSVKQLNERGSSSIKGNNTTPSSVTVITDEAPTVTSNTTPGDSAKHYKFSGGRIELIVHDKEADTTKKKKIAEHIHNWSGVELFENGYVTASGSTTMPSAYSYMNLKYGLRNLGWNLNLFEKDFRFAHNHMQVVTGLGFSFVGYDFDNKTKLNADSSYTSGTYNNSTPSSFIKDKLKESYLTIPLLLELNTSQTQKKNFHIAVGVIGGLKLGSRTRVVYTEDNHTYRDIRKDDYNLAPFKLDATARIGYGKLTLFATYSLTQMFQANKGPQLYPFTVGVRFLPW